MLQELACVQKTNFVNLQINTQADTRIAEGRINDVIMKGVVASIHWIETIHGYRDTTP